MVALDGLSPEEVCDRVRAGQINEAQERANRTVWEIIRANIFTRFNAILGALFGIILLVGPARDGLFGGVLIANALIGIVQELRAKRVLDRLVVLSAPRARVVRSGQIYEIPVGAVVLDDVLEIGRGDQIVADGLVVTSEGLEIDESLVSGEASPVSKPVGASLFSGSFVVAGRGCYQATAVGASAYARQLAHEARRYKPARSELQQGINQILRLLTWALLLLTPLLLASQLDAQATLPNALRSTVAGVVPMVPEGLVLLTSLALATAVTRLGRCRVLLQELPAVETLARVDVVCLDKTGTLTEAELSIDGIEVLEDGSDAQHALGGLGAADPEPNATLRAIKVTCSPTSDWRLVATVPFSSMRKWSAVSFEGRGTWFLGAPDVLLADAAGADAVRQRAAAHAEEGKRVLLLAHAANAPSTDKLPSHMRPTALVTLTERVRPDVRETLQYFAEQGIALKVISGDHPNTVASVARNVGLEKAEAPVDARELPRDPTTLAALVEERTVFGRTSPESKEAIIGALQSRGHVVAMIGDGINDVLGLKRADMGIAMGSGSSVTRGVAQLVLLDGRFASLPSVLGEGRRVIGNVERLAALFVTKTVYALLLALVIGIADLVFPFLPRHVTLVGALTIGIPAFFLSLAPNAARARLGFVPRVLRFAVPAGILVFTATFSAYLFTGGILEMSLDEARTTATLVLLLVGLWTLMILSRPLTLARGGLLAVMAATFIVLQLVPQLRIFFALEPLSLPVLITGLVAVGPIGVGLEVVARSVRGDRMREGWLIRQIGLLLDPRRKETPGLVVLGLVLGGSLLLFFTFLEDVISGDPLIRADAALFQFLQSLRSERVDQFMVAITEIGDGIVTTSVSIIALLWFATRRAWRTAIYWIAAAGSAAVFTLMLKVMLRLPRVTELYAGWDAFSFPSSHATVNTALYGFLAALVAREVAPRIRSWVAIGAVLFVASIAFSRLYLGADWISDVVAGLAFGAGWAALLSIAYLHRNPPAIGAGRLCAALGLVLLVVGSIHIGQQHSADMIRYAVRERTYSADLADWWLRGWRELPTRRVDLSGQFEEPFTVQWAGSLDTLRTELASNGWQTPVPWSQRSGFTWLAPHVRLEDLPLTPRLHNGRKAALVLVHAGGSEPSAIRFVLRLWRSGIELRDVQGVEWPLWIGTVIEERMEKLITILTVTRVSSDLETPRDLLATALSATRLVSRGEPDRMPGWDGSVLLGHDPTIQPMSR